MSLMWIVVSMAGLTYHTATMHEIKARPFSTVRLPCEFHIIEGTDHLKFSWRRKDILEVMNMHRNHGFYIQSYKVGMESEILFSFQYNQEVQEGESYKYKGRIKLDHKAFGNGMLTMLLKNVTFEDEGVYACKARSQHGSAESVMKLLVEDEEAPQVQLEMEYKEWTASCISTGWYKNPVVRWSDGTTDLTNKVEVKIMEARPDGTHRVLSVLHSPVTVHGIYRCLIREAEKVQRPLIMRLDRELQDLDESFAAGPDMLQPISLEELQKWLSNVLFIDDNLDNVKF